MLALLQSFDAFCGRGAPLGERTLFTFGLTLAWSERGEKCERRFQLVWIAPNDARDRTDETLNGGGRIGLIDER